MNKTENVCGKISDFSVKTYLFLSRELNVPLAAATVSLIMYVSFSHKKRKHRLVLKINIKYLFCE